MPSESSTPDPLGVLLELTRVLAEDRSLDHALSAVTNAAMELLPGNHSSVRMFDEHRAELLSGARSGDGKEHSPMSFRRGQGVVGWVAANGEVARLDDVGRDPRFVTASDQGFQIGSMMAFPLPSAGEVVGVLAVTADAPNRFTDRHEMLGRLLANCAIPALERARLERLTVTDHQTLAYNRRALIPRLREEMERSKRYVIPLSVLMMDLDNFKRVNDTHGHAAGDVVLREFADRVRASVRRPDVLVRRGGEEFVLVMPHTNGDQAVIVAERIRGALARKPVRAGGNVTVTQTVSIGAATWDTRESPEALERRADDAMYRAKHEGRNCVVSAE